MKKKILVTGAAGYIGRNICAHLLQKGYRVTGSLLNEQETTLLPEGVTPFLTGPINGTTDWSGALEGVDGVVHLAALVHKKESASEETASLYKTINTDATANLAQQALNLGVRSFVFLSTVAVYGVHCTTAPLTAHSTINPTSYYGQSKWKAEEILTALFEESAATLTILRPAMVYGPGAPGNFSRLSRLVGAGYPLPLGAFKNRRHFLFIDRLVQYITGALERTAPDIAIQLAADEKPMSTKDLIATAAQWENKTVRFLSVPPGLIRLPLFLFGKRELWEKIGMDFEMEIHNIPGEDLS